MSTDERDEVKSGQPGSPVPPAAASPSDAAKRATPPPKPRRESSVSPRFPETPAEASDAEQRNPIIPSAPRVPRIPGNDPARAAEVTKDAEPPRPVSDPPRPRARIETPRIRSTPLPRAYGPSREGSSSDRSRTPSGFPAPRSEVSTRTHNGRRSSIPPSPLDGTARRPSFPSPTGTRSSSPGAPARSPAPPAGEAPPAANVSEPAPATETPAASPAILVMKIIAVGAAVPEPEPLDVEQDVEVHVDGPSPEAEAAPAEAAADAAGDEALDIPVEVAPDPAEAEAASADGYREEAISIPPGEVEAELPEGPVRPEESAKPPPPPRRKSKPPTGKVLPQAKKKQRRAWFEDLFDEEFARADARFSEEQIGREVDFIEGSLGVAQGGTVLDLACGAGRHAVELASRGYEMVGFDLSLYQLALAKELAQARGQKLEFVQGDMREMDFDEVFDGAFCWNTSFGYFEEEKNLAVLERVFRALKPGGMFLIDVINRDFAVSQSPCQNWYEGDSCVCMDDMSLDFITSRLRVKRSVILDDGRTRECIYSIRVYSLHELGKLLHDVGFRVAEASGHPATPGVFFGDHSSRIIVVAEKP